MSAEQKSELSEEALDEGKTELQETMEKEDSGSTLEWVTENLEVEKLEQ